MRKFVLFALCSVIGNAALAEDASPYSGACDEALQAEVQRVEAAFQASRAAWREEVQARFDSQHLSAAQRKAGEKTFATLVAKMAEDFGKLTGMLGTWLAILMTPAYDPKVCTELEQMRNLDDRAIERYRKMLQETLQIVDTAAAVARRDG